MTATKIEWQLFICRACGLIYNEEEGDPDSGLAPGTRFEDIPEDWECPLCGVTKADFEPFEKPNIQVDAAVINNNSNKTPGIIIVGAGIAGWTMAEAIRQHDTTTPITIITACSGDVYHKPELSVAIGRKISDDSLIKNRGTESAKELGINLLPNTFVVGLSAKLKTVRTTRGSFKYKKLILAQGAKSTVPNGIPPEMTWRINHFSSWHGLKEQLSTKAQSIVIVGAGMIGCELAENLNSAGHDVTLVFRGSWPLAKLIPEITGKRLLETFEAQGIRCISNASIEQTKVIEAQENQTCGLYELRLSNSELIEANQIVSATGLQIDTRIPVMAGLSCDNGIAVNSSTLKTEQDDIYALGDCISLAGESCRFVSPILKQAKVIAAQIRGEADQLYHHEQPRVRLKLDTCNLIMEGQPIKNIPWTTVNHDEQIILVEQRQDDRCVSKIELSRAS